MSDYIPGFLALAFLNLIALYLAIFGEVKRPKRHSHSHE